MTTNLIRGRAAGRSSSTTDNTIVDLTGIGVGGSNSNINSTTAAKIFCEFCDIPLIKKMDDIKLLGTEDAGSSANTRFICPRCGSIKDPLKVAELDMLKRGERGQTIRSSSSGGGSEEGRPFVEMFDRSITASDNDKDSLLIRRKGTQLSRALSQTDIINNNNDDPEPNEDSILRGQNNMRILRTETTYPESGRKVVKTFDDM